MTKLRNLVLSMYLDKSAMRNFLTAKEVQARIPCWSLPTIYRRSRLGTFVRPAKFGGRRAWPADEVDAWIAAQFAKRGADRQEAAA